MVLTRASQEAAAREGSNRSYATMHTIRHIILQQGVGLNIGNNMTGVARSVALLMLFNVGNVYGEIIHRDEFQGAALDWSKWNVLVTGSPYNNELQYYRNNTENICLDNGNLVIKPVKESYMGRDYTSGRIYSKFAWKYGRVEVRAKVSNGFGLWPAIWMLPRDEVHGGWPNSGEIDIIETRGQELNVIQNAIHYGRCCDIHRVESSGRVDMPCTIDKFHVYTLDWTPTELVFRVDDKAYYSVDLNRRIEKTLYEGKGTPFNEYFYLILNVAVGGNFLDDPTPSTVWNYPDAEMHVDYVRVRPLKDIASQRCVVKDGTNYSLVCDVISAACSRQTATYATSVCTQELLACCNVSCAEVVLFNLASNALTLLDSQAENNVSCDSLAIAERRYTLMDGSIDPPECLISESATIYDICGSMLWACGGGNTFADVSAECADGADVITCCNAGAATCDENRLREASQRVFQAYYDEIPVQSSCHFGGTTYLSGTLIQCTDGYPNAGTGIPVILDGC